MTADRGIYSKFRQKRMGLDNFLMLIKCLQLIFKTNIFIVKLEMGGSKALLFKQYTDTFNIKKL